ncbi:MAG: IclR family transcriptional regulator [Rhizobiales bacterium]|nr:IclR family transcriptional regulator [Hyphomicrobiales bacterium]
MRKTGSESSSSLGTQSIQRAAQLLKLLTAQNRKGMRLVELYRKAKLERPTTHRILQGLIAERLVRQDQTTKRYFLGPMIYEMGLAAAPQFQLRDVCHKHLVSLAALSADTVFLNIRSGMESVCIDRTEGAFPVKAFVLDVGRRRLLGIGTGGLAILSALTRKERGRILKTNYPKLVYRYARFDFEKTNAILEEGAQKGYVVSDVVEVPGIRSIGMPITLTDGSPIAAISISALTTRLDPDRCAELALALREAINEIEDELATQPLANIG